MPMATTGASAGSATPPAADLAEVISAAGAHLLSYLPLGSLLNGQRSPTLVSTAFHDAVYLALGTQISTLSFSGCPHLRNIDDEALIRIIRNIIEISQEHHPEYSRPVERRRRHVCEHTITCPCPINCIKHLDLSRCRFIEGEGVHFALKHLPHIRRISLSGAKRLDWLKHFVSERVIPDCYNKVQVQKLEVLDISACPKIDDLGVRSLLGSIQGHQIRVLDLSGCSTQTSDEIAGPISKCCRNLEGLSLAGMKKITAYGVGLIAYCCRDTLRSLNVRHCSKVHLMELLWRRINHMGIIARDAHPHGQGAGGDFVAEAMLPSAYAGDASNLPSATYKFMYSASIFQTYQILLADGSIDNFRQVSQSFEQRFLHFEELYTLNRNSTSSINNMFGMLEHLDIGHIGKSGFKIAGCLAAIAWLNGGHIRELNIAGLEKLTTAELNFLGMCSGERLQVLEMPASLMIPPFRQDAEPSLFGLFTARLPSMVAELDMSCLDISVVQSESSALSFLCTLRHCRVLKLDHLPVKVTQLPLMPGLMKLSLQGCTQLTYTSIYNYLQAHNRGGMILELDIRDVPTNTSLTLASFCKILPRLIMLNNRRTKLGSAMKDEHAQLQNWRTGAKIQEAKSRKRKAAGAVPTENSTTTAQRGESTASDTSSGSAPDFSPSKTCCSLLRTGFRKGRDSEQEMFTCQTCKIDFGRFVCYECAKKCHRGHVSIGFGAGYCDCSILSHCSCLE